MEEVDKWQTVQVGANIEKQVTAITELVAAAEGDITKVENIINSGKTSGSLKLSWQLSKQAKKNKYRETIWDKEVWQDIYKARMAYCALFSEIKQGLYNTAETYKDALSQLKSTRDFLLNAKKKLEISTTK